jgi:putative ABC transport system permease protein
MLGVGIAAWTLMFSILNGLILRPLPVRQQERLLLAWRADKLAQAKGLPFREDLLTRFAHSTHTFSAVASMAAAGAIDGGILACNVIVYLRSTLVGGNFFATLGAQPILGRALTPADDPIGTPPVVVISYALWQRQFGGAPSVIGQLVRNNGVYHRIVGVMPANFDIPRGTDVWFPTSNGLPGDTLRVSWPYLALVGRLAPHVSVAAARAEFDAFLANEASHDPVELPHVAGDYRRLADYAVGDTRPIVLAFTGASALLLILACLNVANLLIVRSTTRRRELAVRTALGASRSAVIRQLVSEAALLGLFAAALGIFLSWMALRAFLALAPPTIPRLADVRLDATVLAAAVAATWGAILIFGVGPALWLSRGDLLQPLRAGGYASTDPHGTRTLKRALVAAQVALAQLVLIGAALLINSLVRLEHVELGFHPQHVAFARVAIGYEYADISKFRALFAQAMPRIRAIPGVVSVSVQQQPPLASAIDWRSAYEVESEAPGASRDNAMVGADLIGASYFKTLGTPVVRGRDFTDADLTGALPIAIVSHEIADRAWPGRDPIGQRIRIPQDTVAKPDGWRTVIGVVGDTRYRDLTTSTPTIYLPYTQGDDYATYLLVRTTRADAALRGELLAAFTAGGPDVFLPSLASLSQLFDAPLARPRLDASVLATFAAFALALAAAGIYALGAAVVRQRQRELGIRLAIGARPRDLVRLVTGDGLVLTAIGIVAGSVAGLGVSRALASALFAVRPADPLTFGLVAVFVALVAIGALCLPARRAVRLNPATTLRAENG